MIKYESYPKALRVVFYAIVNRSDNNNSYDCYGKNNITLSPAWKNNPELFFNWAIKNGWEQGKHIHRKNNQDGYNENNCEILSAQEHHCIHSKKPDNTALRSYLIIMMQYAFVHNNDYRKPYRGEE
jgi:hypothetical protein